MPLERVSQEFKDISMSFKRNPLNDDILVIKNASAVARSIRNIVFTIPGEKPFEPYFGSNISQSLFEIIDNISAESIRSEIELSITKYEPRVDLKEVITKPDYDNNGFYVTIIYKIIGIDIPAQELQFVLLPTR